jgi:hypothetical protein
VCCGEAVDLPLTPNWQHTVVFAYNQPKQKHAAIIQQRPTRVKWVLPLELLVGGLPNFGVYALGVGVHCVNPFWHLLKGSFSTAEPLQKEHHPDGSQFLMALPLCWDAWPVINRRHLHFPPKF